MRSAALSKAVVGMMCRASCRAPPTLTVEAAALSFSSVGGGGSGSSSSSASSFDRAHYEGLRAAGHAVNPCNSKLHPSVAAGVPVDEGAKEVCVQEAYSPRSKCWGCGPAAPKGLHLRSFRTADGLEASLTLPPSFCAFPGIISGGVLSTLADCAGNWTAAVALMDRWGQPSPPLTLTASILMTFKEPAPPDTPLVVRSVVVEVKDGPQGGQGGSGGSGGGGGGGGSSGGGSGGGGGGAHADQHQHQHQSHHHHHHHRASVEVDVTILARGGPAADGGGAGGGGGGGGGPERVLATATGIFVQTGAVRSM